MKRIRSAILVVLSGSLAQGETKYSAGLPHAITVYTGFDHEYSEVSFDQMKAELAAIMGPIGMHFDWRSLPSHSNETVVELVVVSFRGQCAMGDQLTPPGETGALGWTHMSDGVVLPFSDVDCDRIRKLISPMVDGIDKPERERLFGRALGRVLAHELYHILTQTTKHASLGLAKACYTAVELVSDTFRFQRKESQALREGR